MLSVKKAASTILLSNYTIIPFGTNKLYFSVKIEDEVEDEVENYKPAFTGLMIFGLFSSSLPKIAGNRYKPGAWIPYKDEEAGLLEIPKNIDDCV